MDERERLRLLGQWGPREETVRSRREREILERELESAPFRGRRVRLHAMVRADVTGEGSRAYLWLRTVRPGQFMFAADGNVRRSRSTRARAWTPMEIEADVPADAASVGFGLALVGDGNASIDAVRLEVVP